MPESGDQRPAASFEQVMELADRLLNDPDVPLEPHRVWAIVERLRQESALKEG